MATYHAEVIDLSLKHKKSIKQFNIIGIRKRFLGLLKIYTISVGEEELEDAIQKLQGELSHNLNKEWYITFHNAEQVIVIFKRRRFTLSGKGLRPVLQHKIDVTSAEDRDKWEEMMEYARSLGVPDDQCDFLPEDFAVQNYI